MMLCFYKKHILQKKTHKMWCHEWGGSMYSCHGTSNARGVSILFKKKNLFKIKDVIRDDSGRYIIIKIESEKETFALVNVYAPNDDDASFFQLMFAKVEQINADHDIIAGDFNTILQPGDIKGGRSHSHPKCTQYINEYLEEKKLVDIWRIRHPDEFRSTWARSKPHLIMERIDFFIISFKLQQHVMSTNIFPSYLSDHSIPYIWLKFQGVEGRGPGYWKFNVTHLEDEQYVSEIKQLIQNLNETISDITVHWEMIKMQIRGHTIKYATRKKKSNFNKLEALEKKLNDVVRQVDQTDPSSRLFSDAKEKLILLNKEISDLRTIKTQGAMLRSKCQWFQLAEKSSKYFHNLEKSNASKKIITKLISDADTVITNSAEILNKLHIFYKDLYDEKQITIDPNYFEDIQYPQVKEDDKVYLNAPIQMEEIHIALKQLNTGKCPGLDGFDPSFFITFWNDLKYSLHALFKKAEKCYTLPNSTKSGVIALMEKLSKNPLHMKNWRPLTMLNMDYKIFAKIIANRLQMVLPDLIHQDQKEFMKNRNITDNLMELMTVVEYCELTDSQAIIVAVNFEKASDTISWAALEKILFMYGFPTHFVNSVFTCFRNFQVSVMNNGYTTPQFFIKQGTKQGCPLSSLIFNLVIETISIKIRSNKDIKGIEVYGSKKLLGQYADDMWTATQFNEKSYKTQLHLFNEFGSNTGLKINYNKTEILRIGSLHHTNAMWYSDLPLKWSDGPVKILGLNVFPKLSQTCDVNYSNALAKSANILARWSNRDLSLIGKRHIVNTLVISQFLYLFQILPSPSMEFSSTI